MRKADALAYFGSEAKIAKALNINQSSVFHWGKRLIPMQKAWQLHIASCKKVPFDPTAYNK